MSDQDRRTLELLLESAAPAADPEQGGDTLCTEEALMAEIARDVECLLRGEL
jgi:hypothetical protein